MTLSTFTSVVAILLFALAIMYFVIEKRKVRKESESRIIIFIMIEFLSIGTYLLIMLLRNHKGKQLEIFNVNLFTVQYLCSIPVYFAYNALLHYNVHKKITNWIVLLQLPVIVELLHFIHAYIAGMDYHFYTLPQFTGADHNREFIFYMHTTIVALYCIGAVIMGGQMYINWIKREKEMKGTILSYKKQTLLDLGYNMTGWYTILWLKAIGLLVNSCLWNTVSNICIILMTVYVVYKYTTHTYNLKNIEKKKQITDCISQDIEQKIRCKNSILKEPNPNMEQIADILEIERCDFAKFIYQDLQTNFPAWLSEQRLKQCVYLIETSQYNLSEITDLCGYSNISAMSKAFKKKYGVPPSEYRKKKEDKENTNES